MSECTQDVNIEGGKIYKLDFAAVGDAEFDYDVKDKDGNIVYEHSKDPVKVANNDTVIYTIRVYNEGTLAGYAEEITDDIPKGLEYLPEHSVNKKYEWKMYDKDGKVTEKVEEAVKITTDYLSEEKEVKSKMTITDKTSKCIDDI